MVIRHAVFLLTWRSRDSWSTDSSFLAFIISVIANSGDAQTAIDQALASPLDP